MKILIVDDEQACLTSLSMQFYGTNVDPILVDNASDALALIETHNDIELILLDLMMPGIDGFDFLRIVKKDNLFNRPIVIQTGIVNQLQIQKALDLGAVDYINKPFDKKQIIEIVNKYSLVQVD
ncbi:MAG: response regulator [Rickettsiales bacterium]